MRASLKSHESDIAKLELENQQLHSQLEVKENFNRRTSIQITNLEQLAEQSREAVENQITEQGQTLESLKKQIAEYETEIDELTETNEEL